MSKMATGKTRKQQQEKVVVGFTGRIDSLVAAYLLKKQGYQVLAVAVNFAPREPEMIREDPNDEESAEIEAPFFGVDLLPELDQVKSVAQSIGIHFYAVDASQEYKSAIVDRLVGARLAGLAFCPQFYSHALLLEILHEKCAVLGATLMATGHFAKLSSLESKGSVRLLSSNDLAHDQCDLLSLVDKKLLSKLMLPLADMRKNEVEKVAGSLGLKLLGPKVPWEKMQKSADFAGFITRRCPEAMVKEGQIIDFASERIIGDHEGIHRYAIGQQNIKHEGIGSVDAQAVIATIQYSTGTIVVIKPEELLVTRIILSHLNYGEQEDISKPVTLFLKLVDTQEKIQGTLYYKNNCYGEFVPSKPYYGSIGRGETVTFFAHDKEGAKVVTSAQVYMAGSDVRHKLSILPEKEDDFLNEDEDDAPLADFVY